MDFATQDKFISKYLVSGAKMKHSISRDHTVTGLCKAIDERRYEQFVQEDSSLDIKHVWVMVSVLENVYDDILSIVFYCLVDVNLRLALSYLFLSNDCLETVLNRVKATEFLVLEKYAYGCYSFHYNRSAFNRQLHNYTLFYMEIKERIKLAITAWMELVFTKKVSVGKDVGMMIAVFVRKSVWDDVDVWVAKKENKRTKL